MPKPVIEYGYERDSWKCWVQARVLQLRGFSPKDAADEALMLYPKASKYLCEPAASTKSAANADETSNSPSRGRAASAGATSGSSGHAH